MCILFNTCAFFHYYIYLLLTHNFLKISTNSHFLREFEFQIWAPLSAAVCLQLRSSPSRRRFCSDNSGGCYPWRPQKNTQLISAVVKFNLNYIIIINFSVLFIWALGLIEPNKTLIQFHRKITPIFYIFRSTEVFGQSVQVAT